ncbi:Histidine kinase [Rubrivivax sp. A210]|uniref:sensor histidine kinase n=1 Tax=Rubrivivax sp. A210 TaxID=2772301 RepID=UPI001919F1DC|nr:histidine kinase [Rubrivivax sp. A210]CAD5374975.1 Histidine kinase [Rubrivivax sp. A210]
MTAATPPTSGSRWQRYASGALRAFHAYANWLVGISWKRFIVLALALLIVMGILHDLPPFTWTITEQIENQPARSGLPPPPPKPPKAPIRIEAPSGAGGGGVEINIGKDGIRIVGRESTPAQAASAAEAAAEQARRAASAADSAASAAGVHITLPPGVAADSVREAVAEARRQIEESIREARRDAEEAARDAAEARRDAEAAIEELSRVQARPGKTKRTTRIGIGDFMMQFTTLWILASAIIKYTYKGQKQAEVKAAQATETAEAESLRRQVVEARMAAMQAQVEPHFLFNTLASIDHLIETDPKRASEMQKNLIALLRASMPTMREAAGGSGGGVRDLGREIAVIRPYLEILKVRMEERLVTEVAVPDGLLSAEFPPMMIQTLVENAIKHGLEPKPEGGSLRVAAEIVHGRLQMTVADTGLGFGKAATAGTGVGLANIRERLQLLYGPKAALTVAENQPSGTVVTITVPYKSIEGAFA